MSQFFDPMEMLEIQFSAARIANAENPDFYGRLIDIMDDTHVEKAIREYFSDCSEWSEDLMPEALKVYHATEEIENAAQDFADRFVKSMLGGSLFR
jgi:hypothetical protein